MNQFTQPQRQAQAQPRKSPFLSFISFLLLITTTTSADQFMVRISPSSSRQINQIANYQIATGPFNVLGYFIPKDSLLLVTFPPQYNTTILHNKTYTGFSATDGDNCFFDSQCAGVTVTYSGNSFVINGLFKQDITDDITWYFQYTIFSIQNPSSISIGSFIVTIYSGNTIYYPPTGSISNTTFKSTLTFQSVNYTTQVLSPTIWGISPLKVIITPNNVIDSIRFTFPSSWTWDTLIKGTVLANTTFTSVSNPSINTSFNSSYTISNLYYYTPYQSIDITVNSIFTPSALRPAGSITLSLVSNNTILEQSTFSLPASSFTNDILRNLAAKIINQSDSQIDLELTFQFAQQNINTDRIFITFPTQLTIPNTNASYFLNIATTTIPSQNISFNEINTNTISFNVSTLSSSQVIVILIVKGIIRPRECLTTSNFIIKTYRLSQFLMDLGTCCQIQFSNRQTITINSIVLSDSQHLKVSDYTFNFTTSVINLITTDLIRITFPPQYSNTIKLSNNASLCSSVTITGVRVNTVFGCSVEMNQLTISSFLSSSYNSSENKMNFAVKIGGVVNPAFTPTTGFIISTLSSNNYVLQQAQGYSITILPNILTSFSVSATSLKTCAPNTKYIFTLGNNSPLSNGYIIKIIFPSDYTYINYNTLQCQINNATYPCTRMNSTFRSPNIIVIIRVTIGINVITSVSVNSVTNPVSQAITGSFSAIIYDQSGSAVQSSNGIYPITMTSASNFTLFTAIMTNFSSSTSLIQPAIQLINSNINSLWIIMVLPFSPLVAPSSMLITISNANRLQYTSLVSSCYSLQILTQCTISTNAGTNNIEITYPTLTFASISSNYIQIQVTYLYIIDYQNIQISALYSINGFSSLLQTPPASISKLYAQPVSNYSVSLDNQILGGSSSATLTIGLSALTVTKVNNFVVYVPQEFGVTSRVINYPVSSFVSNKLTITGLTNPTIQKYSPFLFAVYDANGNLNAFSSPTDSTKNYTFTLGCPLPCRNCSLGVCVDCYTSIPWITSIYLRNSTKTCVSQCSEGQYLSNLPNGVCYSCDTNCLTCLMYGAGFTNGNSTYCLTCSNVNYLYGTSCVSSCPSGYYSSSSVCEPCMANCLNCTFSSTCTSCKSGLSLYNNQCLITCPTSTVSYTNTITNQSSCQNCPSNCFSCSSLLTPLCLSCISGYYLYNGACYTSCSGLSLYISYQMTCASCQCANCTIYSYVCNACNSSYNLYRSQCIATCPSGYYPSSNVCQTCQTNCLSCNSSTYCSLCLIPNALYVINSSFSSCYSICPNNTIATIDTTSLSFVCSSCGGNCLTCQISITFCLSCKPGFILNNNTCESGCPLGLWLISGLCRACSIQCQLCLSTNPYNCSLCSSNYFYYNFSCNSTCPAGTYPNILTSKCSACNSACQTCVNSTNCTSCVNTSYFYQYFCYSNCSSINILFYSFNGSCLICQPQCSTCLTTPFQCFSCATSAYYFNPIDKSCAFNCSHPYYINGTYCSLCQSPCATCDTLYSTCASCSGNLTLWNGQCISLCPSGFYTLINVCNQCNNTCLTCNATACLTCQAYAYRYYKTCILDCKNTDLPITIGSYCTSCAQVPYCQSCQTGLNKNFVCFICIYPFVIFDGNCLNACPNFYEADASNTCIPSPSYSAYKEELYRKNYPYLPPFCFVGILVIIGTILFMVNNKIYKYTYHFGYLIALSAFIEMIFLAYGVRYIMDLYSGDYTNENKYIPAFVLAGAFFMKLVISLGFVIGVIGKYYLNDIRFREWKEQHQKEFKVGVGLTLIFGSRFFKLYYSKLFGKQVFSYRIISVQKFFYEDVFTWISIIADIIDIAAFANINYNIFISYSVLYFLSFQLIVLKGIQWLLLAHDFKKPDRGFFLGDQQEAERMIKQQNEAKQKEKRKFEMESLVKLIRRKSAGNLQYQKLYQNLFFDDFRSVYDPNDYEDVPKVPNRKIQKNINKGKFRKGKRITIEQKLKRFAQSIKPTPPVPQDNGYLRGLIYWKPPKQVKIQKKTLTPTIQSQQSMMKLLQDKQLLYQDISSIHIIDLDDENGTQHEDLQSRYKRRKKTGFGIDGDDTVINDLMYDPTSIEYIEPEAQYDLNGLWNKNYARKQHLPQNISQNRYDENDLRVLYHEPHKKRKSKLNEIRSKYY